MLKKEEDGHCIYSMSSDALKEAVKRTMKYFDSPAIKKVCKLFCDFVKNDRGDTFENLDWRDPELRKEKVPSMKPLIFPFEMDVVVSMFYEEFTGHRKGTKNIPEPSRIGNRLKKALHKVEALGHMTQIAYYGGLRIDEVASLKIDNVIFDGATALCILESKTKNGERNSPFGRLAPSEYLKQFKKYYEKRKAEAPGNSYLFTQLSSKKLAHGFRKLVEKKWNTSYASIEVERVFRKHGAKDFVFHNLRDSFASLLLFRLFFLFPGNNLPKDSDELPCYGDTFFTTDDINRLKGLVYGMSKNVKEGQGLFSAALAVIARLMGHGGPRVTCECYLHTMDWLFYFLTKHHKDQTVNLTTEQATSFHQVTYSALPIKLRKKGLKIITIDSFLDGQRSLIKIR